MTNDIDVLPEVKQILGALLFVAKEPLTLKELRRVLVQVAETRQDSGKDFARVTEADLRAALEELRNDLRERRLGFHLAEVANGYRLENDINCGPWLRFMLEKGRSNRLTRPALETLAIIAYRQPCVRSEIEGVRGVSVDQMIRNLLELELVKVVGRSDLPGRPWLYGTTQKFLEHFGLNKVEDLPGTDELRRMEAEQQKRKAAAEPAVAPAPAETPAAAAESAPAAEEETGRELAAEEQAAEAEAEPATEPPAAESAEEEEAEDEYDDDEFEDDEDDEEDGEGDEDEEAEGEGGGNEAPPRGKKR